MRWILLAAFLLAACGCNERPAQLPRAAYDVRWLDDAWLTWRLDVDGVPYQFLSRWSEDFTTTQLMFEPTPAEAEE